MKYIRSIFLIMATLWASSSFAAITTYDVSSTGKINCANSPHGLWTANLYLGNQGCAAYYDYQAGSTLVVDTDAGTAVLNATAINPGGIRAEISFTWTNLTAAADWTGAVKNVGGGDPSSWLYFAAGTGNVDFFNGNTQIGSADLGIMPNTAVQVGLGANDKTYTDGASSWLTYDYQGKRAKYATARHWDFNMDLTAQVPEPTTAALLLLGMGSLALRRKMRTSA